MLGHASGHDKKPKKTAVTFPLKSPVPTEFPFKSNKNKFFPQSAPVTSIELNLCCFSQPTSPSTLASKSKTTANQPNHFTILIIIGLSDYGDCLVLRHLSRSPNS